MKEDFSQFVQYLIQGIVEQPEKIKIEAQEKEGVLHLLVDVAEEDRGRIIGKGGKIIAALRHLLNIKAQKEGQKVYLTLNF